MPEIVVLILLVFQLRRKSKWPTIKASILRQTLKSFLRDFLFVNQVAHSPEIVQRDKLIDVAEMEGFLVKLQSSTYRSQRCSNCGLVRKANRKGKNYVCGSTNCGLSIDADLNAARNHLQELPDIPISLRKLNLNRKGFYWKPYGFQDLAGAELTVPLPETNKSK